MSEMSDADVMSALQEAAAQDVAAEQAAPVVPETSPQAPEEGAPVEEAPQPEGQAPPIQEVGEVEQPAEEPLVPFNPDDLPEELIPAYRQLQAAFTPRLQEAAAIRQRYAELGGEEAIEQAVGLYQRIADPESWPALYEELYQAMVNHGVPFEDDPTPQAQAASAERAPSPLSDDPDLAPIIERLESLQNLTAEQQALLNNIQEEQGIRQQIAEEELRQAQHLAHMQRQANAVREAYPHFDDDDLKEVIALGSFYNDDLSLAAQLHEASFARRMNRYFEKKKAGAPVSTAPAAGAGVLSSSDERPQTLEEAEAQAIELVRRLQESGDLQL